MAKNKGKKYHGKTTNLSDTGEHAYTLDRYNTYIDYRSKGQYIYFANADCVKEQIHGRKPYVRRREQGVARDRLADNF